MYDAIIIGSGISGLFTLKHLIEEGITNVLVLDKNPEPFGVWNVQNHPCVNENTYTVSSRLYMTISDFPLNAPEFPHHSIILQYYKNYAEHFKLYSYLRHNVEVQSIRKQQHWVVETREMTYTCRYVVIATGTVNDCPNIPDDECFRHFTGMSLHSDSFEQIKHTEGKKILIVGGSDTAVDSAIELSRKNKVTVSIRKGVWFQGRQLGAYEPSDMFYTRFFDSVVKNISKKIVDANTSVTEANNIQYWWGERGSGIKIWRSKCDYLNSYYVKSREIIDYISKGIIIPENKVVSIQGKQVTFETKDTDTFDMILFCTGYKPLKCMRFLDEKIVQTQKYKHIFYPKDPSIMFCGFIRPYLTSIPMLSELQSRWIAKVISQKVTLPSSEQMEKENKRDDARQRWEFPCAYERLKTIVDPYDYANMIAYKIDAQYSMSMLFTDPSLLYKIVFGSWNHIVFRLNEPDKRQIAIDSIETVFEEGASIKVRWFVYNTILYYTIRVVLLILLVYLLYRNKQSIYTMVRR